MIVGPHVFGDGRLGVWNITPGNLQARLPGLRDFGATDVFLPRDAGPEHKNLVRDVGLFAALWTTPHNRGPIRLADESIADLERIGVQVLELNIEVPDDRLTSYIREAVGRVRSKKKKLRLRVNIAPFKGRFLPVDLFQNDPNLYVIEQAYGGNMQQRFSESDCLMDLLDAGVPLAKCSIMYGANVGEPVRKPVLPDWIRRRGSIYQDDLMADAGYLG